MTTTNPVQTRRRRMLLASILWAGAATALDGRAQDFPSRPITLVVPYPAGGGADALARALQPTLSKMLGQPVIVENVSGAGGSLGVQRVLSAPADGHTLLVGSPNEVILAPLAMQAAKYRADQLKMLAPVSNNPLVIMARVDLPANNADDLVALTQRAGNTPVTFGSIGHGSMYHIVAEYFGLLTGTSLLHVPYKGTAPLVQDLAGQQIDFAVLPNVGAPTQLLESGRIKAVAVMDTRRMPSLPRVGTVTESGIARRNELVHAVWAAVLARSDVPDKQTRILLKAVQEAIASGDVSRALEPSGVQPLPPQSLERSAQFFRDETRKFQAMAKSIRLSAQ